MDIYANPRVNIYKYMKPTSVLEHLRKLKDQEKIMSIAKYLLSIHFPWMSQKIESEVYRVYSIDYLFLYEQAYLATVGKAQVKYQEIYEKYVEPLLMNLIGENLYLSDQGDMIKIYKYIRSRPDRTKYVLQKGIYSDIVLEAVALDRSSQGEIEE